MTQSSAREQGDRRYVIGIDFGTLSARAVLVDPTNGEEISSAVREYRHGVIETVLPGGNKKLPPETALQNPADYLEVLPDAIPKLFRDSSARPDQVAGIGIDFTSCTVLPVAGDGTPLCLMDQWRDEPHAWVKLWKHHASQPEADLINQVGTARQEKFLHAYRTNYSSEWFFSKVLETLRQAPEVYKAAGRFIEAGDWMVWHLCGRETRGASPAGFKAMRVYPDETGGWTYPAPDFFKTLDPRLEQVVAEKMAAPIIPLGAAAGGLTREMARQTGLPEGIPVAAANIDAHAAAPACGVTTPGKMAMILGTSTCHLLLSETGESVRGVCGVVEDGIVPGLWGYEAGQPAVGDLFGWYVNRCSPETLLKNDSPNRETLHGTLEKEAAQLQPGQSGLLALDWWNGNRSVLMDANLSGVIVGLTLATQPHEIYRALIEATAFGTRKIIEAFTSKGIPVHELYACGGLASKNKLLLQIYADVTGRPIKVAAAEHASAFGAAMQAAVAAGIHADIHAAAQAMARVENRSYIPEAAAHSTYEKLYESYDRLHEWFGESANALMKDLRRLRRAAFP